MRPEPNNDIDLLLRQLSRHNGVSVSETEEPHLDADELNSYVANALPAPARARYMEHLADCSSCRKLVAQLSDAQGPVPERQSATVVSPSGLKSFLASLFSPMVLRYAVPALGLIAIATLGVLYTSSGRKATSVAELRDTGQSQPALATSPAIEAPTAGPYSSDSATQKPEATRGAVAPVSKEAAPVTSQVPETAGTSAATQPAAAPKTAPASEPPPVEVQKQKEESVSQPTVARDSVKATADEPAKNEARKSETEAVTVTPNAIARRDIQVRPSKQGGAGVGSVQDFKRAAPAEGRTRSREEAKDAEPASETRSVAGRRFRKSAGVWIDTAFDASKSITTVARGSEQFQALVADEPSIRQIAEQLDGEIVVVWKGRTYRIR
jgi:hypothetical protein